MTIYFSGAYIDSNLALNVYQFFESKYNFIADYDVEIYHTDLTDDNVKGWQERNGDGRIECMDDSVSILFHAKLGCESAPSRALHSKSRANMQLRG